MSNFKLHKWSPPDRHPLQLEFPAHAQSGVAGLATLAPHTRGHGMGDVRMHLWMRSGCVVVGVSGYAGHGRCRDNAISWGTLDRLSAHAK